LRQLPLQQSAFAAQISPCCVQNETASEQRPLLHRFEQQSVPVPQGFPAVRHACPGLTLVQVLFVQMPLQQSPACPQAPAVGLSGTHCLLEQAPFTHDPVQHSVGEVHATPGSLHVVSDGAQALVVASQLAEQHPALDVQL